MVRQVTSQRFELFALHRSHEIMVKWLKCVVIIHLVNF